MLIEKVVGSLDDYKLSDYKVDTVVLDHEELMKPHQKIKTTNGRDIAISLPVGDRLFYGAVLFEDGNEIIYVEMADEYLIEIFPKGNIEWGRAAFNIGNMHHPAYFNEKSIITPYDAGMERILAALHIEYEKKTGKLTGIRANVNQTQTHSHNHSHEHSHSNGERHE